MPRGADVYADLGGRIKAARAEAQRVSTALKDATATIERDRVAEGKGLARLAEVRLGQLEANEVAGRIDEADRRALELIKTKWAAYDELGARLDTSKERQTELEAERQRLGDALDAARIKRASLEQETLDALAETEAHAFQAARTERARAQAGQAASKATQAEHDRIEKGKPYEDDRLFMYLWKRRYGFAEYRAIPLIRFLDSWVARLIRYDRAHLDYRMLLQIPERLRAHANRKAEEADAETEALQEIEQDALETAGVPALDDEIERLAHALAEKSQALADEETRFAALREERAGFEAGRDEYTEQAVTVIRTQVEREPLSTLRADARQTRTDEDDWIVSKLDEVHQREESLRTDVKRLRGEQKDALARVAELEELRRRYRRRRYDSKDSVFQDDKRSGGGLMDDLLGGGAVIGDILEQMSRRQRFEVPTRRGRSPGWGIPRIPRGGGGSSSGGFGGGGGFTTGGGF